jgi:hypothetical protein
MELMRNAQLLCLGGRYRDANQKHQERGGPACVPAAIRTATHGRLTGLSGLINRATTSLICSIVKTPLVPKRGINEQGAVACEL